MDCNICRDTGVQEVQVSDVWGEDGIGFTFCVCNMGKELTEMSDDVQKHLPKMAERITLYARRWG